MMFCKNDSEKKVLKNYVYNAAYHLFSLFVPLVTTPYISRVLGPDEIGKYGYAYSVASYFVLFVMLGLKNYGNRTIAVNRDNRSALSCSFCSIYAMQLFFFLLTSILYVIYVACLADSSRIAWILFLIIIASGLDISWCYFGLEEFKYISIRDFIVKVLTTVCVFAFVRGRDDLWKYALILSLGTLISQVFLWKRIRKYIDFFIPTVSEVVQHILPNCILFIPIMSVNLYKTMDKLMLGTMCNSSEVGFYYSSERIINVPLVLVLSLNTVMLPHMSYVYSSNSNSGSGNKLLMSSLFGALFFSGASCAGMMGIAKEFVPIFYGDGFEKCVTLFYILLPNGIIITLTNVLCSQYLIPKDKKTTYVTARTVGAVVNLILNFILIRIWMSVGAAIATCITEVVVCLVQVVACMKDVPVIKMSVVTIVHLLFAIGIAFCVNNICTFSSSFMNIAIKLVVVMVIYAMALVAIAFYNKRKMILK